MEIPDLSPDILKKERAALVRDIAALEPKQKRLALIDEMLQTYPVTTVDTGPELFGKSPMVIDAAYVGMGLTDALIKFVNSKSPLLVSPREIRDGLNSGGFTTQSANFGNVVFTTCKRLHESGKLEKGEKNGHAAYRLSKGPGNTGGNA